MPPVVRDVLLPMHSEENFDMFFSRITRPRVVGSLFLLILLAGYVLHDPLRFSETITVDIFRPMTIVGYVEDPTGIWRPDSVRSPKHRLQTTTPSPGMSYAGAAVAFVKSDTLLPRVKSHAHVFWFWLWHLARET